MTKSNPLDDLIAIYGPKFEEALKAGDLKKARDYCADYQDTRTGRDLPDFSMLKAFAMRVSFEAVKSRLVVDEGVTVSFSERDFYHIRCDQEFGMLMMNQPIERVPDQFTYYGVNFKRVSRR